MVTTTKTLSQRIESARQTFKPIIKDRENSFFKNKYATIDAVIDAVQLALSSEGVRIASIPQLKDGVFVLSVRLINVDTEEFEECIMPLTMGKPQEQGIAITYARRYAITSMLNLCTEDDNDGNLPAVVEAKVEAKAERKRERAPQPVVMTSEESATPW